jgi:hypothetical protein
LCHFVTKICCLFFNFFWKTILFFSHLKLHERRGQGCKNYVNRTSGDFAMFFLNRNRILFFITVSFFCVGALDYCLTRIHDIVPFSDITLTKEYTEIRS